MNRILCILMLVILPVSGLPQTAPTIADLYNRLIQPSETNAAAREIADMARNDSKARDFIAGKLPSLIINQLPPRDARTASPVWANAVRLAGQLKIVAAVPALGQALSGPEVPGGYDSEFKGAMTFGTAGRLVLDVVGRALADIGDPSVPVVADSLSKGDFSQRRRAIHILENIDSPVARKALLDHLPTESDPRLSSMIQNVLHISP
jgi:hypothetical protein